MSSKSPLRAKPPGQLPAPADLVYFLEVANSLNISRAADRLGISQPSLSLAVRRLEQALGTSLLVRQKTGVRLSRAGQRFTAHARTLLLEWQRTHAEILQTETEVSGRFTLGCHASVALYTLTAILPKLLAAHPKLELRLQHDLSRRVLDDVLAHRVDFGLVVNPTPHAELVIRPLCKDEVGLWCGPLISTGANATTGRSGRSANPAADLTANLTARLQDPADPSAVLICDPDLLQTQAIIKQLAKHKLSFARTLPTSNLEVIAALVSAGTGIGILPGRVATRVPAMGLRPLLADGPRILDRICLVYRPEMQKSKASRVIAQSIEAALKVSP